LDIVDYAQMDLPGERNTGALSPKWLLAGVKLAHG
jgi:hypothetical protein